MRSVFFFLSPSAPSSSFLPHLTKISILYPWPQMQQLTFSLSYIITFIHWTNDTHRVRKDWTIVYSMYCILCHIVIFYANIFNVFISCVSTFMHNNSPQPGDNFYSHLNEFHLYVVLLSPFTLAGCCYSFFLLLPTQIANSSIGYGQACSKYNKSSLSTTVFLHSLQAHYYDDRKLSPGKNQFTMGHTKSFCQARR